MKKLVSTLILVIVMVFSVSFASVGFSEEKMSCDELLNLANTLHELANQVEDMNPEDINEDVDAAFRDLVEALKEVAVSEDDAALTDAVNSMVDAYNAKDKDAFVDGMDQVVKEFDELYAQDCE